MSSIGPKGFIPIRLDSAAIGGHVTRSSSSSSSVLQRTSSATKKKIPNSNTINPPANGGGKVSSLRPKRTSPKEPSQSQESTQRQSQETQEDTQTSSLGNVLSFPTSPFNFFREQSDTKRIKTDYEAKESGKSSAVSSSPSSITNGLQNTMEESNPLIKRINCGTAIIDLMKARDIYQFLLEHGMKITYLNLTNLDKNIKSADLIRVIEKIATLKTLINLRILELSGFRGDPAERGGMAFSKLFEFIPNLERLICSNNAQDMPEFITPIIHGLKFLSKLTHLIIMNFTDQDLEILVKMRLNLFHISVLHLGLSSITKVSVLAMAFPWFPNLKELRLETVEQDVNVSIELPMMLRYAPKLNKFELNGYQMNVEVAKAFGIALKELLDLEAVAFTNCQLTKSMLQVLLEIKGHQKVKILDFSFNNFAKEEHNDPNFDIAADALATAVTTLPSLEEVHCVKSGLYDISELRHQCNLHKNHPRLNVHE